MLHPRLRIPYPGKLLPITLKPARVAGLFMVSAILLALVLAGCGDDGPASISKAEMATGIDGTNATGVTTTFKPTDNPFYTAVSLSNPKSTTKVKAVLTAVATADGTQNREVTETEVTTSNSENFVSFKFSLPNPWPTGKYKVDIMLDGKASQTLNFEVQ